MNERELIPCDECRHECKCTIGERKPVIVKTCGNCHEHGNADIKDSWVKQTKTGIERACSYMRMHYASGEPFYGYTNEHNEGCQNWEEKRK